MSIVGKTTIGLNKIISIISLSDNMKCIINAVEKFYDVEDMEKMEPLGMTFRYNNDPDLFGRNWEITKSGELDMSETELESFIYEWGPILVELNKDDNDEFVWSLTLHNGYCD